MVIDEDSCTMSKRYQLAGSIVFLIFILASCAKPRALPDEIDPHLVTAYDLLRKDPGAALLELSRAKNAKPAQVAHLRGLIFEKQRKLGEAEASFKQAIVFDPEGMAPRVALARILLLDRRVDEAREHLRFVVKKDPTNFLGILLYAMVATDSAQHNEALSALRAWPQNRPKPDQGKIQVPLRAEYFLALSAYESDKAKAEQARLDAHRSEFGNLQVALTLTQYALHLDQRVFAQELLARLAGAGLLQEELQLVARYALALGQVKTAGRAIGRVPGNVRTKDHLVLRGRYEIAANHPRRALADLDAAHEKINAKDIQELDEVEALQAQSHLSLNEQEAVEVLLNQILSRSPESKTAHVLFSRLELKQGEGKLAVARLVRLVEHYPKDAELLNTLGETQVAVKDLAGAVATFRVLMELSPGSSSAMRKLSDTMVLQGLSRQAVEELKKWNQEWPSDLSVLRALVALNLKMGSKESAVEAVAKSPIQKTDPVGAALLMADVYEALRRPDDVRATLQQLVQSFPKNDRGWSALARSQAGNGDVPGMETSLRTVLELNPRALNDKARLASLLNAQGRSEEAARLFVELSSDRENDVVALNNAAMLYSDELKEPQKAVELAERAYEISPTNAAIVDTLGWALARRGSEDDLARALKLLTLARETLTSGESAFHLAYVLLKAERGDEARALLVSVLAIPGDEKWRAEAQALLRQ